MDGGREEGGERGGYQRKGNKIMAGGKVKRKEKRGKREDMKGEEERVIRVDER